MLFGEFPFEIKAFDVYTADCDIRQRAMIQPQHRSAPPSQKRNTLSVLIFKDNLAARSFEVRLSWIYRLSALLGVAAVVTFLSAGLAVKYYMIARRSDGARVIDLERRLADLQLQLQTLQASPEAPLASAPVISLPLAEPTPVLHGPIPPPAPIAQASPAASVAPIPAPSVVASVLAKVTPTSKPVASEPVATTSPTPSASPSSIPLPKAALQATQILPESVRMLGENDELAIELVQTRARWQGPILQVTFALQYIQNDGANQTGRIVVLARGPSTTAAHPAAALNASGGALIYPERGEFFSVSRYRAGRADFGPVTSRDQIRTIDIFVFSKDQELLLRKTLQVGDSDE